jgi:ABC-2 type transport system ATP-binding protein
LEQAVLEIRHLSKSYGPIRALNDFSLEVFPGDVLGILGPNGSGKTTTLGILMDILKPDSGEFLWFGQKENKHLARKRIGALLEQPVFYPYLSAVRNLQIIADIKGVSYDKIDEVLHTVELAERKNSKFSTYSLGMKQRLAVAATLLGNPEVLILDEPTNGLDPKSIALIRNLIKEVASRGMTVLLASHLLDEVQKTCSHVAVLNKGKLLHTGRVDEVLNATMRVEVRAEDMDALCEAARKMEFVAECKREKDLIILYLSQETDASIINKNFVSQGIYLSHLAMKKRSLESYFLELLTD